MLYLFIDDSNVLADPMFTVPLFTPSLSPSPSLCYEIYGEDDKHFNLLSDQCISVNAHYKRFANEGDTPLTHSRPFHVIDEIGVRISGGDRGCFDVLIQLHERQCIVAINGKAMQGGYYRQGSLHIVASPNHVSLSVPNCGYGHIVLKVQSKLMSSLRSKRTKSGVILREAFLEFGIESGAGITPSVHGLIGKYMSYTHCVH